MRLKSSSINSSETSAKYSCPSSEQKEDIQDSGVPEDVDMAEEVVWVTERVEPDSLGETRWRSSNWGTRDESPLADTVMAKAVILAGYSTNDQGRSPNP